MTPQELQIVQLKSDIMATQVLLIGITKALARTSQNEKQFLGDLAKMSREKYSKMTVPALPAEYSDLVAAEFQSTLDNFAKLIEPKK